MYKVAICDDEKLTCHELENNLMLYSNITKLNFDIDIFYSGDELLSFLKEDSSYQLLFLDIELGILNGIEIGSYIREILNNESLVLIYISSKEQYAMQLFQNRPFDFLIKPVSFEYLKLTLDKAFKLIDSGNIWFEFKIGKTILRIKYSDIIYFRSLKRKVIISSTQGDYEFYGNLTQISKSLSSDRFMQIHKSYIIQYDFIAEYSYEWIKTVKNEIINISKPFRRDVRSALLNR